MKKFITLIFFLLSSSLQALEEHPGVGILFGTKNPEMLKYFCQQEGGNKISCEFNLVSITKLLLDKDVEKETHKMQEDWANEEIPSDKEICGQIKERISAYKDGKPINKKYLADYRDFKKKPIKYQNYLMEQMETGKDMVCKLYDDPRQFKDKVINAKISEKNKTRRVSSRSFSESFEKVRGSNIWVRSGGVQGQCGIVDTSKFEKSESREWQFISEKKVTNKKFNDSLLDCSQLDEEPHLYESKREEMYLGCDVIEWTYF